jgi:nitroreductase
MNPVIEAIKSRRSVRSYEDKPVPREILQQIVDAGNEAPSAMNVQPWRFVVVADAEFRKRLAEAAAPLGKKYFESFKERNPARYEMAMKRFAELKDPIYYSAPAIVFVIGPASGADDCPMACLNMMLAAYSFGLASCWVRLGSLSSDAPEILQRLGLKSDEKIYGPILLGYPTGWPDRPAKREPSITWI